MYKSKLIQIMAMVMKINNKIRVQNNIRGGGEPKRQRIKLTKSTSTRTVFDRL